ncbi:gamma-glutamyl-gamma-aminobutyrate hydrolase family protein [Paraburkholderia sp. BR14312]|uniref:gamma-glutamyl-gamma-aminobutyrate hydrolase family protein n=1 Tax=unclassified Paraburkholderia TaxID=2615204 RepID=UPI0034CFCAAF
MRAPLRACLIVVVASGGLRSSVIDGSELRVNSLYKQGIAQVGQRVRLEAVADDGGMEALYTDASTFQLALQWPPEWHASSDEEPEDARRVRQGM